MIRIDTLCAEFTEEVIVFIKEWMKIGQADEINFHRYRMRLLAQITQEDDSTIVRLLTLCKKSGARSSFDIQEIVSDKMIGDSTARYIFAKLLVGLNNEYLDLLEKESDNIKAENHVLKEKADKLYAKINVN
jgi:hypothetical protein